MGIISIISGQLLKSPRNGLFRGYNLIIKEILAINSNDPKHTIDFIKGEYGFLQDDGTLFKSITIMSKRINAKWVAGNGNGGLPSNLTLEGYTWYHGFKIIKEDGTEDYGFDTDILAANLLADATGYKLVKKYPRIGSLLTDKNANIRSFTWHGFIPFPVDEVKIND